MKDGKLESVRHTFTHRARWYDRSNQEGDDIRIRLEDEEGSFNHYPHTEEDAEALWENFKAGRINARGKDV